MRGDDARMRERRQERRAETLDLERARDLAADRVPEPSRREDHERQHHGRRERQSEPDADCELARSAPAQRPDDGERDDGEREALGDDGGGEREPAPPVPVPQERRERAEHEQRQPEVVPRQRDRSDEERRDGDERERARARSGDHRDGQAPHAERGHQPPEDLGVAGVPVRVDRGDEDRQGPRRVFDREVAIRQQAVVDRTPVTLVDRRVGDQVSRVEPVVEDDPAADEHRGRGRDSYTARSAIAANGKNHGR